MCGGAYPDVRAEALLGLGGLLHQPLPGLQFRVELRHRVLALLLLFPAGADGGGRPMVKGRDSFQLFVVVLDTFWV